MKKIVKFNKIAYKLDKETVDGLRKEASKSGVDLDKCDVIRKGWASETKAKLEEGSRSAIKYVSTRTVDMIGDVVVPKGLSFKQFIKTGMPVYYNHSYAIPQIGRDEWVRADDWGVKVKQIYAETGEGTLANILWKLTSQDMNKQSSVGIIPLEVIHKDDDNFKDAVKALAKEWPEFNATKKDCRRIITKGIMFEHSDVSMACNTDTDVLAVSKMFKEAGANEALLKQLGLPLLGIVDEEEAEEAEEAEENIKITLNQNAIEEAVVNAMDMAGVDLSDVKIDVEIDDSEEIEEIEEEIHKKKVTLVKPPKPPRVVRLIQGPTLTKNDVGELVQKEIRRRLGRLV